MKRIRRPERAARRHGATAAALVALALVASACANANPQTGAKPNTSRPAQTDVSLGGAEASGFGSFVDPGASWSDLLYQKLYGTAGVFFDLANTNATLASIEQVQLPEALAQKPNIVTIFASVLDMLDGTSPTTYGAELATIVSKLRAVHSTVLVANAIPLQLVPTYTVCLAEPARCGTTASAIPSPSTIEALAGAYDVEIAEVARHEGAILVNVNAALTSAPTRGAQAPFVAVATRSSPSNQRARRGPSLALNVAFSVAGSALVESTFLKAVPTAVKRLR